MQLLEERIKKDGRIRKGGVLKVDGFLNRQLDPALLSALAEELGARFANAGVTQVLTIEPNAIALATLVAQRLGCTAVFAKKSSRPTTSKEVYSARVHSYTTGRDSEVLLPSRYLSSQDRVLVVDDFLINGSAMNALLDLVRAAGAVAVGAGVAIEYKNAKGGEWIRSQGVRVEALALVDSVDPVRGVCFA